MKQLSLFNLYIYCMGLLVLLVSVFTGFYSFIMPVADKYFDVVLHPLTFTINHNVIFLIPLGLVLIIYLTKRFIK